MELVSGGESDSFELKEKDGWNVRNGGKRTGAIVPSF